jgi:uncharacterized membrane protein
MTLALTCAMYLTLQAALRVQKALVNRQHVSKAAYQDVIAWLLVWCVYVVYTVVWDTFLWMLYARGNMIFSLFETIGLVTLITHRHELREVLLAHETEMNALLTLWHMHATTVLGQAWVIGQRWMAQALISQKITSLSSSSDSFVASRVVAIEAAAASSSPSSSSSMSQGK